MNFEIPHIPDNIRNTLSPLIGTETSWDNFVQSLNAPVSRTVTLNTSRISHEQFATIADQEGRTIKRSAHGSPENYTCEIGPDMNSIGAHRLHQCGYLYIQESAASIPAHILANLIGPRKDPVIVLDLAASPGGKTVQLANKLMQDNAHHIVRANDSNASRMKALGHNIQRMGIPNIVSTCINGERFGTTYPELFDAILLDAPCSGEGTSFKSDASLDMRKPQRIKAIASLQYQLIISAYKALKPGGVMIYSTCTLNPYENEITIRRLIEYVKGEIELIPIQRSNLDHGIGEYLGTEILTTQQSQACLRARPHRHQTGGFFIAAMRKPINYRHEYDKIRQIQPKQIAQRINQEQQIDTDSRLTQYRGKNRIDWESQGLVNKRDSYHLISRSFDTIKDLATWESIGIPILRSSGLYKHSIRPLQGLAAMIDSVSAFHCIDISSSQAQDIVLGTLRDSLPSVQTQANNTDTIDEHASYRLFRSYGLAISISKWVNDTRKHSFRGG